VSYLYRPTPVVNLGNGAFASKNVRSGWPGATMQGIPRGSGPLGAGSPTGAAARMRRVDTRMQPWIKSSGTMGSFIPNGLGEFDDSFGAAGVDWGSAAPGGSSGGFDWSGAADISPIFDAPVSFSPGSIAAPDFGTGISAPNLPINIGIGQPPAPLTPSPVPRAGAGATGTGLPGTQPLQVATQSLSLFDKIFGTVKAASAPATTPYKALPGYGGTPVASGASWFSQSTVLPQIGSNAMVVGIGVAALVLLSVVGGGGYAAGRSRR